MKEETKKIIEKIRKMGFGELCDRFLLLGNEKIETDKEREIRLLNQQIGIINARLKELYSKQIAYESKH